jgi:hypothetical protein
MTDAVQHLRDYKLQLKLWAEIAEEGVNKNQSLEEIRDRIISEDSVMKQLAGNLKTHKIYPKTTLINSIQGFIDYTKKMQGL